MKKNIKNTVWIIIILAIALTACNSQDNKEVLSENIWTLISIGSEENLNPVFSDSRVTLEFNIEDNQLGGTAGCNTYFAGFEINGDNLNISAAGSTMMYCEPEQLMTQEFTFLAALGEAHHYSVQDGQLIIEFGEGQLLIFE